jgi:hypothetical protein
MVCNYDLESVIVLVTNEMYSHGDEDYFWHHRFRLRERTIWPLNHVQRHGSWYLSSKNSLRKENVSKASGMLWMQSI